MTRKLVACAAADYEKRQPPLSRSNHTTSSKTPANLVRIKIHHENTQFPALQKMSAWTPRLPLRDDSWRLTGRRAPQTVTARRERVGYCVLEVLC